MCLYGTFAPDINSDLIGIILHINRLHNHKAFAYFGMKTDME